MVRYINVAIDDEEYEQMNKQRGERSWRRYIIEATGIRKGKEQQQ